MMLIIHFHLMKIYGIFQPGGQREGENVSYLFINYNYKSMYLAAQLVLPVIEVALADG